jgi:hypothetical protein
MKVTFGNMSHILNAIKYYRQLCDNLKDIVSALEFRVNLTRIADSCSCGVDE